MQYTTIMLSALTAVCTLAVPTVSAPPNYARPPIAVECKTCEAHDSIFVRLRHSGRPNGSVSDTLFQERLLPDSKDPTTSFGPFTTVSLELNAGVHNKNLRCQILDEHKTPILVYRNGNLDTTFSDQNKGAWTLKNGEQEVCEIVCDASFVAQPIKDGPNDPSTPPSPPATTVEVILSYNNASRTVIPFVEFNNTRRQEVLKTYSQGPFNTVQLNASQELFSTLRCKIEDDKGHAILLQRKDNTDITFSDGGAQAPWHFLCAEQHTVSKVICDPEFVKVKQH